MEEKNKITIALAGNPNAGKTTLFNALTGSNQYVGNWPGVTVEKKEGTLKNRSEVVITDLPGIYSLSPYTLEEVVARNYLIDERPDAILNIVDGTNLERNLYLTSQLTELGIPVTVAINMTDVVKKRGDKLNCDELSKALGCPVVEISALKGIGVDKAIETAVQSAKSNKTVPMHTFSGVVEHALAHVEEACLHHLPTEQQRWYAIKIFESDSEVLKKLNITPEVLAHIKQDIVSAENELEDDAESIITNERYVYIGNVIKRCYKKKDKSSLTVSDKIDKVVTNRFLALPIFIAIMFLVYFISVTTVGAFATDWANDGVFGDGFHLFGIGQSDYEQAMDDYARENLFTDELKSIVDNAVSAGVIGAREIKDAVDSGSFADFDEAYSTYGDSLAEEGFDISAIYDSAFSEDSPVPDVYDYGLYIPGIPVLAEKLLVKINCAEWLQSLLLDGIIGGVGAVLGFIPQMIVLFTLLAILEACGYMARIAFILDRIFRRFGLSGKSFIPMLIGSGCGVPGIMASRTIENQKDRRMTIITTTFMPCSAKLPIIALISTALFGGAWWVAPSAYFLGIASIIISGIILKKTRLFEGEPAPFVMELPEYRMPSVKNVFRSVWERASSFIKKAGTIILISSIIIWLGSSFGVLDGRFTFSTEMALETSVLGYIARTVCRIFSPLGFGNIKATIATVMGLVAKEEVVGVFGVLDFEGMTKISAYSFLAFNLLCAPCFAAIGAIKREMNDGKWTAFAVAYQCLFAYAVSLVIFQIGSAVSGTVYPLGLISAIAVSGLFVYMLFIKRNKKKTLERN
ncbi:MAG: ferrous iron transporter B [Christensenellaceae bacterium]